MNLESTAGDRIPFNDPESVFGGFAKEDIFRLAECAGDFMLAIDRAGVIRDVAANVRDHGFANQWIGRKWVDTVNAESRPKIEQLLNPASDPKPVWRQVNHEHDGEEFAVSYQLITPRDGQFSIAVARDLRTISALQQRLFKIQQSMERDYLHLRQTESRYRLLFDTIAYPVLICEAENLEILQANHMCYALLDAAPGSIIGKSLLSLIHPDNRDKAIAYLGAVAVNNAVAPTTVRLNRHDSSVSLGASGFRQSGKHYWLITMEDSDHQARDREFDRHILDVVEKMPDAFVLTDAEQTIIAANQAFAELVQAASVAQLIGTAFNRFIGRPDVDLALLRKQFKDHQHVRNFSSLIHDLSGREEPVEISAIMIEGKKPLFGYLLRSVGRRDRDLPGNGSQPARSIDQLTELVGRKTLKEIVRDSTDLIERMCIEAALVHTSDNRASAAEILGLSRQSLYSKMHRHGLGNLSDSK